MDLPRKDLEMITVDLRCDKCPEGGPRCAKCQGIVDAAVAATLAEGIDPSLISVKA